MELDFALLCFVLFCSLAPFHSFEMKVCDRLKFHKGKCWSLYTQV